MKMIDGMTGIMVGAGITLGILALITCYCDWKADRKERRVDGNKRV